MRNVKYINSYANKEHHEQFNAILLFALNSYFRVKMYSGKDSKNNISEACIELYEKKGIK